MLTLKNKTVLLICPIFYDYHEIISSNLKELGANVIFFPERKYNIWYSFFNNFSKNLLLRYQKNYYNGIFESLPENIIDYFFVIRGCQLPEFFILKLKNNYPGIINIMYQWDSEKVNHFIHLKPQFDRIFSFDHKDAINYDLTYLPLFYSEDIKRLKDQKNNFEYDFFILCSYNRERYKIISDLKNRLCRFKLNFIIFMPISTYYKERLKGQKIVKETITFVPLTRSDYLRNLSISKVVLDISPSIQSGLSIRIIESLGAGKHIITTNEYALKEFEESQMIHVLSEKTNFEDVLNQEPETGQFAENYSLSQWLKNIFHKID